MTNFRLLALAFALTLAPLLFFSNWGYVELAAVFTSYVCTFLCVTQSRVNFVWGAVTTALYFWLLWTAELKGLALFNLVLSGTLVWGWFRWSPAVERPVRDLNGAVFLVVLLLIPLFTWFLQSRLDLSLGDAVVTAASVQAQVLLVLKYRQTWIVWAGLNVLTIWLFFSEGLNLAGTQYLVFLVNTWFGWRAWSKTMEVNIGARSY